MARQVDIWELVREHVKKNEALASNVSPFNAEKILNGLSCDKE